MKRVRRKIKNKLSAAESRKRKKNYVEGLEERVEKCTKMNRSLHDKVINLEKENRSVTHVIHFSLGNLISTCVFLIDHSITVYPQYLLPSVFLSTWNHTSHRT